MNRRLIPYAGAQPRGPSESILREVGVVVTAKRKPNLTRLRKKYQRDLEELRALAQQKGHHANHAYPV